jgi:1,4-dihydroxy-2-naphthoate octaprenyltransferase
MERTLNTITVAPASGTAATHGAAELGVAPNSLRAWLMASRPPSLFVAVSPVLLAVALVYERTATVDLASALLALAASVVIQIISNLQNDVGYTVRGAEQRGNRKGLPRATALGLLGVAQVRRAIGLLIGLALLLGLPLIAERGWPVLAMGLASIAAALAYMGGPRPIAYTPLGETVVFLFFGIVAVVGTDYVLTGVLPPPSTWVAAIALGALSAAALNVNNYRDAAHDADVGRRTFAVVFGAAPARRFYALGLALPFALLLALAWLEGAPLLLAPLVLAPAVATLWRDFCRCPGGLAFNDILVRTFAMELKFAALLALGALATRWLA